MAPSTTSSISALLFAGFFALWLTPAFAAQRQPQEAAPPCCVAPEPAQPVQPDTRGTPQQPLTIEQPVSVEVTNFPTPAESSKDYSHSVTFNDVVGFLTAFGTLAAAVAGLSAVWVALKTHRESQTAIRQMSRPLVEFTTYFEGLMYTVKLHNAGQGVAVIYRRFSRCSEARRASCVTWLI